MALVFVNDLDPIRRPTQLQSEVHERVLTGRLGWVARGRQEIAEPDDVLRQGVGSDHRGHEAEGLRPESLPAYNAILWTWAVASALALLRETRRGNRRWFVLGLLNVVPLRMSAQHHFAWAHEQARTSPSWWNRGLRP